MQDESEPGGEPTRTHEPRRRGLGKGLGAILSAPSPQIGVDDRVLHDPLTSLPNRVLLDDKLNGAVAACHSDDAPVGVFFVALDRFSRVNELFGHQAGDDLLNDVAARLCASRRRTDTVARFGGDEFVVVCPYIGGEEDAARVAQQLLDEVARPTSVHGVEHQLTASVGVVVTDTGEPPDTADTLRPDMLLGNAALAMRYAKDEGGGSWRFFEPVMREHAAARHRSRQGLRAAMESGDLVVEYQPVIDLASGTPVSELAIIRPSPPDTDAPEELGAPAPSVWELLDEAEEAGLGPSVARWLLDTTLCDLSLRMKASPLPEDFRLWIKVSLGQVTDPSFLESLDELTAKYRLAPSVLGLDVREAPTSNLAAVASVIDALGERGVLCSLDDFGAGPSNLDWLQQLPIAGIKLSPLVVASIDPATADAPDDPAASDATRDGVPTEDGRGGALVRGLVSLGSALGLSVVAQGVTTAGQAAALRLLGCEFGAGPYLDALGAAPPFESAATTFADARSELPERDAYADTNGLWAVPGSPNGTPRSTSTFLEP